MIIMGRDHACLTVAGNAGGTLTTIGDLSAINLSSRGIFEKSAASSAVPSFLVPILSNSGASPSGS
jgi:hypothetical protein